MGTKFNNVYLRCNLNSDGTIPETGFHAGSPDMFSAGTEPIADFRTVLATPESYASMPDDKSITLKDNYCYLRCKNNTDKTISAKAELYYAKAGLVMWPDTWKAMMVDFKQETLNDIPDIPPGGIGVVERPFIWTRPEAIDTNDHYCYIGRLTTEATPNPIPDVENPITMSSIIKTNLMYAQRNIQIVDLDSKYSGYYKNIISASPSLTKVSKFHLFLYPHDMQGWDFEVTCSMRDSQGKVIGIGRTNITSNDDIYLGQCMLEPGFNAVISVYFYNNGIETKETTSSKFVVEYAVQDNEISYAKEMGVYDPQRSDRLIRRAGINDSYTAALTELGDYTAMFRTARKGY